MSVPEIFLVNFNIGVCLPYIWVIFTIMAGTNINKFYCLGLFSEPCCAYTLQRASWLLPIVDHGVDLEDEVNSGNNQYPIHRKCVDRKTRLKGCAVLDSGITSGD